MTRRPPTTGRFKPGNNANPLGAAAHNKDLKKCRRLSREQVAEIGSLILEGNLQALTSIKNDSSASVLKVWFASVAVKAISRGDASSINTILDRIVGKVKEEVKLSVKNEELTEVEAKERLEKMVDRMHKRHNGIPDDIK